MVSPAAERVATVRHVARMFLAGASLTVPLGTIALRRQSEPFVIAPKMHFDLLGAMLLWAGPAR